IDWRVIPANEAMSDAREPSTWSVEKTALCALVTGHPSPRALATMSACIARFAMWTIAINGF
ncbi:MAG: hypothetical protein ABIO14_04885, partial [Aeromicrobium sp.]